MVLCIIVCENKILGWYYLTAYNLRNSTLNKKNRQSDKLKTLFYAKIGRRKGEMCGPAIHIRNFFRLYWNARKYAEYIAISIVLNTDIPEIILPRVCFFGKTFICFSLLFYSYICTNDKTQWYLWYITYTYDHYALPLSICTSQSKPIEYIMHYPYLDMFTFEIWNSEANLAFST